MVTFFVFQSLSELLAPKVNQLHLDSVWWADFHHTCTSVHLVPS